MLSTIITFSTNLSELISIERRERLTRLVKLNQVVHIPVVSEQNFCNVWHALRLQVLPCNNLNISNRILGFQVFQIRNDRCRPVFLGKRSQPFSFFDRFGAFVKRKK